MDNLVDWYPREDRPTLRVNFVSSLDGSVTLDGFSAGLSGPGDKLIFGTLRMVCDALVVAAGTIRSERYDALRLDVARRDWRRAHGLPEYPLMVVVSRSLDLDPKQEIFSDAPIRPIVITSTAAPADRRAALAGVAEILPVGEREVDLAAAVGRLHARGATQLLCEGGPHLLGSMIAADVVDELCLTVSPLLTGGSAGRIAAGPPGPARPMSLRHILAEDDMLFFRYARRI
ncbi:MAG TPA: pyrimidine reductase family protein [Actinoplanes sp.]